MSCTHKCIQIELQKVVFFLFPSEVNVLLARSGTFLLSTEVLELLFFLWKGSSYSPMVCYMLMAVSSWTLFQIPYPPYLLRDCLLLPQLRMQQDSNFVVCGSVFFRLQRFGLSQQLLEL